MFDDTSEARVGRFFNGGNRTGLPPELVVAVIGDFLASAAHSSLVDHQATVVHQFVRARSKVDVLSLSQASYREVFSAATLETEGHEDAEDKHD